MVYAEMVVAIVLIGCVTGLMNNYLKSKNRAAAHAQALERVLEQFDTLEDHVKNNLEKRVANLETILTDKEFELNQKFKDL